MSRRDPHRILKSNQGNEVIVNRVQVVLLSTGQRALRVRGVGGRCVADLGPGAHQPVCIVDETAYSAYPACIDKLRERYPFTGRGGYLTGTTNWTTYYVDAEKLPFFLQLAVYSTEMSLPLCCR